MAKRKRLTPARPDLISPPDTTPPPGSGVSPNAVLGAGSAPPIAQVAGDAAATAALSELSTAMAEARAEGRMIESLPLEVIDDRHMVRDRLVQDSEEMRALMTSLDARGQQTPIEVVELPEPRRGCTHGLVSGWRRLLALRQLQARERVTEPGPTRFDHVKALVITPKTAQGAYVAMVEENEIRANLSFYERGRIVMRAHHEGIYPTRRLALQGLFGSVSRPKRSKIGSFATLVEALDQVLRFPSAISEKLGLRLVKALNEDPEFGSKLGVRLRGDPPETAEEEIAILTAALGKPKPKAAPEPVEPPAPPAPPASTPRLTGLDSDSIARRLEQGKVTARFDARTRRIDLTGPGVDQDLYNALQTWLAQQDP